VEKTFTRLGKLWYDEATLGLSSLSCRERSVRGNIRLLGPPICWVVWLVIYTKVDAIGSQILYDGGVWRPGGGRGLDV